LFLLVRIEPILVCEDWFLFPVQFWRSVGMGLFLRNS
jgi:hypothetical protein